MAKLAGATKVASICANLTRSRPILQASYPHFLCGYMTDNHLSDLRFDALEIHENLRAGIRDAGFEYCTPIQAATLPIALQSKDVAGQAQTGTGKTAAFLIAAYQRLLTSENDDAAGGKSPRVFALAPTRELAVQIADDAKIPWTAHRPENRTGLRRY